MDMKLYNRITFICLWVGVLSAIVADHVSHDSFYWYACLGTITVAGLISVGTYFYHQHCLIEQSKYEPVNFFAKDE
jgi:hypothetical protein